MEKGKKDADKVPMVVMMNMCLEQQEALLWKQTQYKEAMLQ